MKQLLDRWAPLTGLASVACSLVGVMLALNQPQDKDSDARSSPTSPTIHTEYTA